MNSLKVPKKLELPSEFINSRLSALKKEFVKDVKSWLPELTTEQAIEIVESEEVKNQLFKLKETHLKGKMLFELAPVIMDVSRRKAEQGWTQNALHGVTALGITIEKATESGQKTLNIGGKNVQVNLDWKPKWLKK